MVNPHSSSIEFIPRYCSLNSSPGIVPRIHSQSSASEFGPSSLLGSGTCFKAYNLIQSQDAWLELKNKCYKTLSKSSPSPSPSPSPPSPLLPTTRSAELKLS